MCFLWRMWTHGLTLLCCRFVVNSQQHSISDLMLSGTWTLLGFKLLSPLLACCLPHALDLFSEKKHAWNGFSWQAIFSNVTSKHILWYMLSPLAEREKIHPTKMAAWIIAAFVLVQWKGLGSGHGAGRWSDCTDLWVLWEWRGLKIRPLLFWTEL